MQQKFRNHTNVFSIYMDENIKTLLIFTLKIRDEVKSNKGLLVMYGGEKLNNHLILRYGLTKEFFEKFSALQYSGIELPLTMIYDYHFKVIQSLVNKNISNPSYINKKNYPFRSMKDIQSLLYRAPQCSKNLADNPRQKTILLPGRYLPIALNELQNHSVILLISSRKDAETVKNISILPSNFQVFNLNENIKKAKIPDETLKTILIKANKLINENLNHEVFGTKNFNVMLQKHIIKSIKQIYVLQTLIVKKGVRVILEQSEYISPGNILSLLAHKFNLTFINVQYFLISDVSIVPSRASYYCVWGENTKIWLEGRGISGNHVIPIGSLRFEIQNVPSEMKSRNEIMNMLKINKKDFIITFITQDYSEKVNHTIMNWILKVINSIPVTVVIKPHRRDKLDYSKYLQNPNVIIVTPDLHLYDLIKNTDFIMTISSNVAIEGAMYNKGILILQPDIDYDYRYNYNDYYRHLANADAGYIINNDLDLLKTITKLVNNKEDRDNLVRKGQIFLKKTLDHTSSPSFQIKNLIQKIL